MSDYIKTLIARLGCAVIRHEDDPTALETRCSDILNEAKAKWQKEREDSLIHSEDSHSSFIGALNVTLETADGLRQQIRVPGTRPPLEIQRPLRTSAPTACGLESGCDENKLHIRRYRITSRRDGMRIIYEEVQS